MFLEQLEAPCRSCGSTGLEIFHDVARVPVCANHLASSHEEALAAPCGALRLGFCPACGFIQNTAFEPARIDYASGYEDSQSFSPHFRAFTERLARRLVESYGLRGRRIVEIGCGKGDFLALLCEVGSNCGVGIDPAWEPNRLESDALSRIEFVRQPWGPDGPELEADFVCCRHTLEHLPEPREFVRQLREALEGRPEAVVFFEVPDAARVIHDTAFWDLYYEHCSYFSLGSLARLFGSCSFEVIRLEKDYGDQYLLLDARPSQARRLIAQEDDLDQLHRGVRRFARDFEATVGRWRERLAIANESRERVVLWGGGSKAVSFLNALGGCDGVEAVVDINPYKQGLYLPGSGHAIVAPEALKESPPDHVIAMNPLYLDEIRARLEGLGLRPRVTAL